jgi:hypothetical protein
MEYCNCSYEKYSCYYNINNCRYIDKLIKHFPLIEILLKNTTKKYNLINNNDYYIDIDEFNKLFIYIIGWIDSIDYKKAMLVFYEQNNITPFKRIFVDQFEFAVKTYF